MGQLSEGQALHCKAKATLRRNNSRSEEYCTLSFSQQDYKIYLPPLHIKPGLNKISLKVTNKEGKECDYLRQKVPRISEAKIKEGIFIGPQVQQLFQEPNFKNKLNATERRAWDAFENVCSNVLGNKNSANYTEIMEELLFSYRALRCNVTETPFPAMQLGYFSGKYGRRL
jgi:hypothetical protein